MSLQNIKKSLIAKNIHVLRYKHQIVQDEH